MPLLPILLPLLLALPPAAANSPAAADPPDEGTGGTSAALREEPVTCLVGAYMLALRDFDPARHSFGTDLWLWSDCATDAVRPLEGMELLNAKDVTVTQDATVPRGGRSWSYRKVGATIIHDWDMRSFPFDRQDLVIVAEYTSDIAANFVFTADLAGTRLDPDVKLDGWWAGELRLATPIHTYPTTFGDPLLGRTRTSEYSQFVLSLPIRRDATTTFFKLTAGVYGAFLVSLLSFMFDPRQTSLMSARMSIVVGSLFATLVNLRATEGVLGRSERLTLVDRIHLLALAHFLVADFIGVLSRRLVEDDRAAAADRTDRIALLLSLTWFVLANLVMIAQAQAMG